jgi:RHS repeat-associated protein
LRIILIFAFACFGLVQALELDGVPVRIAEGNPVQFFVGEKVFVAVEIDGVTGFASEEGQRGTVPYVLENVPGNPSWIKPNGRPVYNSGLDNAEYHWQNNQTFWLELSGIAPARGDYSATVRLRNTVTGNSVDTVYSFSVIMPSLEYPGVVVAMHDSAASYGRQMEIYSSLMNTSMSSRTLQSPYFDYYATRRQGMQPVVNVWEAPSNGCVQVLDCGQGNFVIRHRYSGNTSFAAGARRGEFRIGYNEVGGPENPYYFSALPEKDLFTYVHDGYDASLNMNVYADYSYAGSATNYTARAMRRNLFFNPYEALYDHSGNRLWGSAPSWFSEQSCTVARVFTGTEYNWQKFRTNSVQGFCTEGLENTAPTIAFPNAGPDTIYEGEDYFLRPLFTDAEGDSFTVELVNPHPDWIEVGTPADYWHDYQDVVNNNVNTLANRRVHYIRSRYADIRKAAVITPGTYTYTVKVTDIFEASSTAQRSVVVLDGGAHPASSTSGLAVLVGDETWFKKYQLDVASGIVNYSGTARTLAAGWHYDYYGTFAEHGGDTLPYIRHWHVDTSMVNVSYTECGSRRFRIRYTGKADQTFLPNRSYLDNKAGLFYRTSVDMVKNNDWSIEDFYEGGDTLRRRRYAPNAPLYDGNDNSTPLWGIPPDWAPDCENPPEPGSSSSSNEFVSSSSFNPYGDLAVRFADNSTSPNTGALKFDIVNSGGATAPVGGYELRFYYNGNDSLDASRIVFDNYQNLPVVQSRTAEQCGAGLFVYKVKLSDDALIQPGASLPSEKLEYSVHLDGWQNYDWKVFASWMDVATLTYNPKMALFDADGNLVYGTEAWPCNGYVEKELKLSVKETVHVEGTGIPGGYLQNAIGDVTLEIRNDGDSSLAGPVFVDFYVTHPAGQVPVLIIQNDTLSVTGKHLDVSEGIDVARISSGNKHVFRFTLTGGIPSSTSRTVHFRLMDQCLFDCPAGSETAYGWNMIDDWSAVDGVSLQWIQVATERVAIYSSSGKRLYGIPDPSSPSYAIRESDFGDTTLALTHSLPPVPAQVANRTDAIAYSGGQLLSGGDFETDWLQGWELSGSARSVRGDSPQGSRHLGMSSGSSISQVLPVQANKLLVDSGATLVVWHRGTLSVNLSAAGTPVQTWSLSGSATWAQDTLPLAKNLFNETAENKLTITASGDVAIDDAALIPGQALKPSTYAVRFTSPAGEELETRAYDGAEELLVTDSERDAMGRTWKKYLPFALTCSGADDCNSESKTVHNPGMADNYYTASNPDYPDAGGIPYAETKWKPDPMATKDVEGAPGKAFGVAGVDGRTHLVKSYASGVNLSGVNLLDSASLDSAVSAVRHGRAYDGDTNYRAARDATPTHLWELNIDQDGRRAFTVKDGEGRVIVSGSLDSTGKLLTRSVNELDARGNVVKSHPPMSCGYTPKSAGCVTPNEYGYDAQSRVVRSKEPDAGETRTFYDLMGRVRATQTQRQIDSGAYSVVGYDNLDRAIYTGEWKTDRDSAAVRAYFNDIQNQNNPIVDSLTPGTVTRTFYDRMPARDTLGVELYPASVQTDAFKYGKTRVVAVVSDVSADSAGNVIRISTANAYDKYGRITANYAYNPAVPADSLKMLAVETEYDLEGKVTRTTKYPYGVDGSGASRKIVERYTYDRFGRIDSLFSKNGGGDEMLLATYSYYPTGSVKTVNMGNSLTLTYTYHISGAVKTAKVETANGGELYSEMLHYEDCGDNECEPQYNGNISYMVQRIAHNNRDFVQIRDVAYYYDQLNRLTKTDDLSQDYFDDIFEYDAQGRITAQRRAEKIVASSGGEYAYYDSTNKLKNVADGMGGTAGFRNMGDAQNFVYDRDGNLIEDKSKNMMVVYDWRGMPTEFTQEPSGGSGHATRLVMMYDGSGRRISKTFLTKSATAASWDTVKVTHYTGIGTEVRENLVNNETKVVVNMPQGLGRYGIEDADHAAESGSAQTFEWFLKNHLGSTMLVYGTGGTSGGLLAVYDYRAFGEMIELTPPPTGKVTENFTGKEHDDEIALNYFGARYLDPMLGMWISVDPKRQFASLYLYAGNGMNPINVKDEKGNYLVRKVGDSYEIKTFSRAEVILGWIARDVVGTFLAAGAMIISGGTALPVASSLYGAAKGYITEDVPGLAIATGENLTTDLMRLENPLASGVSGFLFSLFDMKRGYDQLMGLVDSPEFIDKFNSQMKSNDGPRYNSFPTPEAAEKFAKDIQNSLKNENQEE